MELALVQDSDHLGIEPQWMITVFRVPEDILRMDKRCFLWYYGSSVC